MLSLSDIDGTCYRFSDLANFELSKVEEDSLDEETCPPSSGLTLVCCALAVRNACVCEENLDHILKHETHIFALIQRLLRKLALTSHKYDVDTKVRDRS